MTKWKKYINLPFKDLGRDFSGVDCYGLMALIYKEELGLQIPDYTELVFNNNRNNIYGKEDHIISSLGIKWLKVEDYLKPFDILIFNDRKDKTLTCHVGLYIGSGKFIHALEDKPSQIERLEHPIWKNKYYGALRWQK